MHLSNVYLEDLQSSIALTEAKGREPEPVREDAWVKVVMRQCCRSPPAPAHPGTHCWGQRPVGGACGTAARTWQGGGGDNVRKNRRKGDWKESLQDDSRLFEKEACNEPCNRACKDSECMLGGLDLVNVLVCKDCR